jgi:hypothetical protein
LPECALLAAGARSSTHWCRGGARRTTQEIDDAVFAWEAGRAGDARLSRLHQELLHSINHVVCHGIPATAAQGRRHRQHRRRLPILDGWHGDSSRMYLSATYR